jgi:TPR repeat protein
MSRFLWLVIVASLCWTPAFAAKKRAPAEKKVVASYDAAKKAYVDRNYGLALKHFRVLADHGDNRAIFFIGFMYETGRGVTQSYKHAHENYLQAAAGREIRAMNSMGYFYERGIVVDPDVVTAHMWYNLAASQGHGDAMRARNVLNEQLSSVQVTKAQKMAKDWDNSHPMAQ